MKSVELIKNEKKSKNIVIIITSILMLFLGISFFFDKYIVFLNSIKLFYVVMLLNFGLEFTNYILTRKITGMDFLYKSLAYIIASLSGLIYLKEQSSYVIGYTLIGWLVIMLIIKLIKIEDLRNKLNEGVFINIFCMSLFVLLGFLVTTNVIVGITNKSLILGFFFTANGLLNMIENIGVIKFDK